MLKHEICFGLIGNFIFSTGIFTYKRYRHEKYDEIIRRLEKIEALNGISIYGKTTEKCKILNNEEYYTVITI